MNKILKYSLFAALAMFLIFLGYFFIGTPPAADNIEWGVNFSQKHSQNLGLDWREVYSALLFDLKVKKIKLAVHWDIIEPQKGEYDFTDLDWQVEQAKEQRAELLLAIGMKTPRWPECHLPQWAVVLNKEGQQQAILEMLEKIVSHYQGQASVVAWQVENEPFFPFGVCPWSNEDFLKKEVDLVRLTDADQRPIYISDSGEGSTWFKAAQLGDVVDITMYRKAWFGQLDRYIDYPLRPIFYWRKAQIVKRLFNKEVVCGELQAEPWGPRLLYDSPLSEQRKTMDEAKFKENIAFAKQTGLKEFYLWGAEWWYWLKVKQDQPEIWQEASKLFL